MASAAPIKQELPVKQAELPPDHIYFGPSEAMQSVRQKVERAAGLNVPMLILGESGAGKEVLAHFVHDASPWRKGPFVKVNCPAIPGTLIESELFGFQKGAFTGANANKPGRMELAQGGSLFMDEIAELDSSLQAKLLHVLQDGHFTRIGDHEERRMDARIICATNRNLAREIEGGGFRADLFYRINVISITLPSLRERREDIPYLAEYLRQQFNRRFQRDAAPLSKETLHLLQQRDWPGNVRGRQHSAQTHRPAGHAAHGARRNSQGPPGQSLEPPPHRRSPENQLPRAALQGAPSGPSRQAPAAQTGWRRVFPD